MTHKRVPSPLGVRKPAQERSYLTKSIALMLACRRDWGGNMQPLVEAGRLVPGPAARKAIDVAGLEVRDLKSVEMETRLGAGVALAGVGSSDAVVGELY